MSDTNAMNCQTKDKSKDVIRPDLSAKLERLKRGLVADTVRLTTRKYPSLKDSQLNYGLKSGHFGAYDPLRRRSKMFRSAVNTFAPPYYFWHKEFINAMKLKPLTEKDESEKEKPEEMDSESLWILNFVECEWCHQSFGKDDLESHKVKRCKNRHEFLGNGYYRCSCCKEGFLSELSAKHHVSLHFPNQKFVDEKSQPTVTKNVAIICRDQAKRRKWL